MGHKPYGPYERYFKRPLDLILSFFAMVVLSPLLLILSIAVYLDDPGRGVRL